MKFWENMHSLRVSNQVYQILKHYHQVFYSNLFAVEMSMGVYQLLELELWWNHLIIGSTDRYSDIQTDWCIENFWLIMLFYKYLDTIQDHQKTDLEKQASKILKKIDALHCQLSEIVSVIDKKKRNLIALGQSMNSNKTKRAVVVGKICQKLGIYRGIFLAGHFRNGRELLKFCKGTYILEANPFSNYFIFNSYILIVIAIHFAVLGRGGGGAKNFDYFLIGGGIQRPHFKLSC